MSGKDIENFIRLQYYSLGISKIVQITFKNADFFFFQKGRVLKWMSSKNNTQGYTENENKFSDL